jgi:hypothetical protein
MSRSVIPGWAIRALQEFIVRHGISSNEALRQVIIAETDCIVPDTPNRSRQVYAGEKHPLSVFMSKRTARNIATREDTKRMMVERSEAHKREMAVKAEEVDRLLAQQLKMMAQGVRPVLNEVGEAVKEGGRQRVERLPPAVHVQAIGAASAWAARQNPQAQKVEMEHSGKIDMGDLETARAARIAREAELAALLAARTADE